MTEECARIRRDLPVGLAVIFQETAHMFAGFEPLKDGTILAAPS